MVNSNQVLPSGKLTQLWKITIFNGNTHYFYGHCQQLFVCLPEGKSQQFPAKSLQVLGAGGCGKVFLANKWPLGTTGRRSSAADAKMGFFLTIKAYENEGYLTVGKFCVYYHQLRDIYIYIYHRNMGKPTRERVRQFKKSSTRNQFSDDVFNYPYSICSRITILHNLHQLVKNTCLPRVSKIGHVTNGSMTKIGTGVHSLPMVMEVGCEVPFTN